MAPPAIGSVTLPAHGLDVAPIYQADSTRRMSDRLKATFAATDWHLDPNKPAERVRYYTQLLSSRKLSLHDDTTVREQLARELLQSGDSDSAIRQLEEVRRRWQASEEKMPPEAVADLGQWLAIAYLRLGETENCAHMHGQRACLFPLQRSAAHQMPRGAEGAVREFTALLDKNPADYQSQWLLNVAYMQLGRYPQDVPKRWLAPESLFKSEYPLPEFPEVAASSGIDITGHAGGVLVEDFDKDGRLDIMVSSSGPLDQMHLFHNNGDGTFSDITRASGLIGETGGLNLVLTDYNNDGRPDVFVLRGGWWRKQGCYPLSLLRNNGNGTFDDVTEEAGLLSAHPTNTAAVADFDNDGWLDIFVGHESTADDPHPSQLFHNNRDGTFTDIAAASGPQQTSASSKALPGETSTTTAAPTSIFPSCTATTSSSATTAPLILAMRRKAGASPMSPSRPASASNPIQLRHVVLRLRQRRLAGHLRLRLLPRLGLIQQC